MRAFARLYRELDETNRTGAKLAALQRYLSAARPADAAWAVYFLSGRRLKGLLRAAQMGGWAAAEAGVPPWLFAECHEAVGDLAETVALLLPEPARRSELPLHVWVEQRLLPLRGANEADKRAVLVGAWQELEPGERFVLNKLVTGSLRVGVSQRLVTRALAAASGVDAHVIAHRLVGAWQPSAAAFEALVSPHTADAEPGRPYPFFLAHPLEDAPESLGERAAWQAEWKWDGIRVQLVLRGGELHVWSRGDELVTAQFPELAAAAELLPDGTVLDGEVLPWRDGAVLPFAQLQRRLGRKRLGPKLLWEVPVRLLAFDLLEDAGRDIRSLPLHRRRARLAALLLGAPQDSPLLLSPVVEAGTWDELAALRRDSRRRRVEGLMLKRRDAPYGVGRRRGPWWKWKVGPHTVDAVLVYAQRGHGRRASLYTDYTFALWHDGALVPFAKAYSGLTDAEIRRVDRFVRRHTRERFGPVRSVAPELVFELGFEGIQPSRRHRSGVAVRFPRILRWRTDKAPAEADTLERVRELLPRDG